MPKKLTKKRAKLLAELTELVGGHCYNGNIQNYGPGGMYEGEGRSFQYSLTVTDQEGNKRKCKYPTNATISPEELISGHFKFGANQLNIVYALDRVLAKLEGDYGLKL
ncbi:hypothetical protein [uncultured Ruegeria sp.]|uniref:hypothetical protein n=1 Tax=uncultured Ruegeria sp. TaxID=259304 RepID=UPI00260B3D8C|nr:hypothetical protein [uncultured Ruegeria sp.]